jgi:hypothetical protein
MTKQIVSAGKSGIKTVNGKSRQIPSRGLGDTIAKATKAVGIKPCGGCKKRQAALNKLVPYKSKKGLNHRVTEGTERVKG